MENENKAGLDWEAMYYESNANHKAVHCENQDLKCQVDKLKEQLEYREKQRASLQRKDEQNAIKIKELEAYIKGLKWMVDRFATNSEITNSIKTEPTINLACSENVGITDIEEIAKGVEEMLAKSIESGSFRI